MNASMVGLHKNKLKYYGDMFELGDHQRANSATDCLTSHSASLSWDYIYTLMQECTMSKDLTASRHVENLIIFHGLDSFTFYTDHLIRLYASCACLDAANAVFCRVSRPSCYTWTSIITAHANLGEYETALQLFEIMQSDGSLPNKCLLLCILKVCCDETFSFVGELVHDQIVRVRLESDLALGSLLVRVYSQCGSLHEARWIFDHLSGRDTILWSCMVTAYANNGQYHVAFDLVEQMLNEEINPDSVTFLCMLKACSSAGALEEGRSIHNLLIRYGLESDVMMGSSLVDMYAKCEFLNEAQNTFDALECRNTVSWNSLIAGYAQLGISTIGLFDQMQVEGFVTDKVTFLSVLKSCRNAGSVDHGTRIHDQITLHGFDCDEAIASALVGMYAKCGRLEEADGLFQKMPDKDVIAWSEMISGYAEAGQDCIALHLFETMQVVSGIAPIKVTVLSALKACSSTGRIDNGRLIHDQIVMYGFEADDVVGSSLLDLYAKCMKLDDAHIVFDNLLHQDVVSWGTLIAAYAGYDNFVVFELFQMMQQQGVRADKFIFLCIVTACGSECIIVQGQLVHHMFIEYYSNVDMDVVNALVSMYAKCGFLDEACKSFESSCCQDAFSWGVLIAACIDNGFIQLAFSSFIKLQELGLRPDSATIACILKACGSIEGIHQGRLVHNHLISDGVHLDSVIGSSLISMYFKCGMFREAVKVFEQSKNPDGIFWDLMIAGYSQNGLGLPALEYFQRMREHGVATGLSTFACTLKSCGIEGLSCQGRLLHDKIVRNGMDQDLVLGNALVDMYAKCGGLGDAKKVFSNMTLRDEVSWGAILCCNSLWGDSIAVLQLYAKMQLDGIKPDIVSASCAAKACSSIGVLKLGRLIHDQVIKCGIETDVVVGTALVDMYAKFLSPKEAHKIFDRIRHVNEASWTALLSASVQHSQMQDVKDLVNDLKTQGFVPDSQTHTSILAAWTRAGQLKESSRYTEDVMEGHALVPPSNHFNGVIDSLSRVGWLHEAEKVLLTMPVPPDVIGWVSLLTACQTFGNTEVGSECLDHVARLNLSGTGSYLMMANMYADAQKWSNVSKALDIRKNVGAWKLPGQAWLELAEGVHVFHIGDCFSSPSEVCNFKSVRKKMKEQGFVPQVDLVLEVNSNCMKVIESPSSLVSTSYSLSDKDNTLNTHFARLY